jgi:diguanylate cyclase (GGDEF)-like protein/PAS domain S-box-containing protein
MYGVEARMADRSELVEAALEVFPEGLALLDIEDRVVFWNRAAETITGYSGANLLGRPIPGPLQALAECRGEDKHPHTHNGLTFGQGALVHAQRHGGRDRPAIARRVVLRDGLGARIGVAVAFHPAEEKFALPHGQTSEGDEVKQSQAEFQEHLEREFEAFVHDRVPLGVLWVQVDQAAELRKTHGARACEAMLENVERTLVNALRPGEEVGRWGDDEFLLFSHEPHAETLANHARVLAGIARTADFRWWGDRISLTVSAGVALAESGETLAQLLNRAQAAMVESIHAGGNHVSLAPRREACSQS